MIYDLHDLFREFHLLLLVDYMELAVAAQDKNSFYAMSDQMIDQFFFFFLIDILLLVVIKRGNDWCNDSFDFHLIFPPYL